MDFNEMEKELLSANEILFDQETDKDFTLTVYNIFDNHLGEASKIFRQGYIDNVLRVLTITHDLKLVNITTLHYFLQRRN